MPKRRDAKLLQVLVRQARKNRLVYSRNAASYFLRPKLRSQSTMSIVAPRNQGWRTSSAGAANVSRVVLAGLRASQVPVRSDGQDRHTETRCLAEDE